MPTATGSLRNLRTDSAMDRSIGGRTSLCRTGLECPVMDLPPLVFAMAAGYKARYV